MLWGARSGVQVGTLLPVRDQRGRGRFHSSDWQKLVGLTTEGVEDSGLRVWGITAWFISQHSLQGPEPSLDQGPGLGAPQSLAAA